MSSRGHGRARTDQKVSETVREMLSDRPQKELAELLDLDQSAVSRALAGKRAFNLREITLIADWMGVDPEEILFTRPSAFAFRCDADSDVCDVAAQKCRSIVQDFLAFRTAAE